MQIYIIVLLMRNDNVQALKKLLNECIFYGEIGSSLHAEGVDILKEIYNAPNQAIEPYADRSTDISKNRK